jgi:VWFA-related protein
MTAGRIAAVVLVALPLVAAAPAEEQPRDVGLVERTVTRLAQIDVTVSGPPAVVDSLTEADFEVRINLHRIPQFTVDRVCREEPPVPPPEPVTAGAAPEAPPAPAAPAPAAPTYVFYLDHGHLTQSGRQLAIETLRDLIPKLVAGGARGTLLSNAMEFHTVVPLTADAGKLLAGLDAIEGDPKHWDPYSALEESRLADIAKVMSDGSFNSSMSIDQAVAVARNYQREERWRQQRDLRRIEMVLARLSEVDPPKAFLYFADTMRQNAGEHYMSFFGDSVLERNGGLADLMRNDSETAVLPFDRVVNQAAAFGIRFYTIESQGLQTGSLGAMARSAPSRIGNNAAAGYNTQRIRDAQGTLKAMALETGGKAFLNGVAAPKIAKAILEDLRCLYVISFDPSGLPEDVPLRVAVTTERPNVKLETRGRLVVQSESTRLSSRLLSTFAAPEMEASDVPMRLGVIPVGFEKGKFKARVQVAIPPQPVAGAVWDLGASLVSKGQVRDDASGRLSVPAPNVPIVLEQEMNFGSGPFELVAVAHETTTDQTASARLEGSFPDPDEKLASVGPISILQPSKGAYLRNGATKGTGSILFGEHDPLSVGPATAAVGLVCRARDQKGKLVVERSIVGESETRFPDQTLELGQERCAQILDVIPEKTLSPGRFRYVIRVMGSEGELARGERAFLVPEVRASR